MIVSIVGNNHYLMHQKLASLSGEFSQKYGDLSIERIDGERAGLQAVLDATQNLPFLVERKMVILRDASGSKELSDQIEQIISSLSDKCDLIIYEPQIDRRSSYFKVLKSQTELEDYQSLEGPDLAKWLAAEAKKQSAELGLADANYLVEKVGDNQALLANELSKLIIYNPKIDRENIDRLVPRTPQSRVFDLLDAAFTGNKAKAYEYYDEQRAQNVEPQEILAMIGWQLAVMTITKLGEGRPAAEIAKDNGLNPYPIQKAQRLISKMSPAKLKQLIDEAYELDLQSKTSAIDIDEALKSYIALI